jgi:hypothetical protein
MLAIIQCRKFCLPVYYPKLKIKIYEIIILPVLLHECKTWLHTLREKHKLRVCENKALRKIFGPRKDEVTGRGNKYIIQAQLLEFLIQYCSG